ncbi:MAG: hypothetical protein IID45_09400 [Planctomycetes bacterium]|nr:hypothetical protein [Planctomycetota bacterium]
MTDRKIDLKTPWVAGVLAYLFPGAGHFYQKRYFKAGLYSICIFGTFLYGMSLGEWKTVYWTENPGGANFGQPGKRNYGYLAQLGVGGPTLFAYVQSKRYRNADNRPVLINWRQFDGRWQNQADRGQLADDWKLTETIDADFEGTLLNSPDGQNTVTGRIHLEPRNRIFRGSIEGTITYANGKTEKFKRELAHKLILDSRILGHPRRDLSVGVAVEQEGHPQAELVGTIPRSFTNWFEAPLDDNVLQNLNDDLGKHLEMALVFTWIAGLLNILAIWDAVQGPAYGFGDEKQPDDGDKKSPQPSETDEKEAADGAPQKPAEEQVTDEEPPPPEADSAAPRLEK